MKQKQKRKHLESTSSTPNAKKSRGSSKSHGRSVEDGPPDPEEKSEYFTCYTSFSEIVKEQKAAAEPGPSTQQEGNNVVVSEGVSRNKSTEFKRKSQEVVAQPKPSAVVPPGGEAAEEKSSASQYFSCFSSLSKLIRANEDGVPQTDQVVSGVEHSKKHKTSSRFPYSSFPFHLVDDPKPSVSSAHMEEETVMKVYYMHVKMKRGVAVLSDQQEDLEPPTKKTKIEEMTSPENVQGAVTPSCTHTKELLTGSESSQNNEAQEKRKEADSPPVPPAAEEYPRAKTPEWLVAMNSGFRCVACCRVFPSLEVLQEHVKHGVSEGFSCHTFHLTLTCLRRRKRAEKRNRGQMKNTENTDI